MCGSTSAIGLIGLGKIIISVGTTDEANWYCDAYAAMTEDFTETTYYDNWVSTN